MTAQKIGLDKSKLKTMEKLKRADDDGSLRWGWFSLIVSPKLFFTKW